MNENKAAKIDNEKCIACGACVYQCPFGAIADKSYILDVIDIIKKSEGNSEIQGVRPCCPVRFQSVYLCKVRSGYIGT